MATFVRNPSSFDTGSSLPDGAGCRRPGKCRDNAPGRRGVPDQARDDRLAVNARRPGARAGVLHGRGRAALPACHRAAPRDDGGR